MMVFGMISLHVKNKVQFSIYKLRCRSDIYLFLIKVARILQNHIKGHLRKYIQYLIVSLHFQLSSNLVPGLVSLSSKIPSPD